MRSSFYISLMEIHLASAAIATVVTVAEILKNNGLAVEKSELSFCVYLVKNMQDC